MSISNRTLLLLTISAVSCTMGTAFLIHRLRLAIRHTSTTTCQAGTMKELPAKVVQYSQVPGKGKTFTATSIPKGLLKNHNTRVGIWGVIRVSQGKLQYQINDPEKEVFILDSTTPGIVEPQIHHQVAALTDDVEFVVEFYRYPDTGPVDEKREGL